MSRPVPRTVARATELIRRALAAGWKRKLDVMRRPDGSPWFISVALTKRAPLGDWAQIIVSIKHPDPDSPFRHRRAVRVASHANYSPELRAGYWHAGYEIRRLAEANERAAEREKKSEISFDI